MERCKKGRWISCYRTCNCCSILLLTLLSVSVAVSESIKSQFGAKVDIVHPFQSMILRATDISPIVFYGENGRVHMEYRPILPKLWYSVSVLGELMRGIGATVNEVMQRASVGFPGPHYGAMQSPYYLSYPRTESSPQHHQHQVYHPEQRSEVATPPPTQRPRSVPQPVQISLSSHIRSKYLPPPASYERPPSTPEQNILEVISKAISGA